MQIHNFSEEIFPELDCRLLTQEACRGSLLEIVGRKKELDQLKRRLLCLYKPNILLVGSTGVGKTALVEALALDALRSHHPFINKWELIEIHLGSLVANTAYRGELEKKVMKLLEFLAKNPERIAFIDEAHTLFMTGDGKGGIDVPNLLKQVLSKASNRFILATTTEEAKIFATDPAFKRRFRMMHLAPLSYEMSQKALFHRLMIFQSKTGIAMSEDLLSRLNAYLERGLEFCIDLLDEIYALCLLEKAPHVEEIHLQTILQEREELTCSI